MFWNAVLGLVLIRTNKQWRSPVMITMATVQMFLTSMILGSVFFDIKLGSSPFMLLRDVIKDDIFKVNPDFVPADGSGLNPLLQNYWMVIHPPTLFLGFASTVVPFAYCIGGLISGRYREWIRPALPWAQFSALTLGVGILMGAYWAYETLNFGGYWNWDPVENAIFVPWLTLVASMHTMIAYKKNDSALKTSIILVISTFILILYSTFLTRSGVLGETSVHSFTDLGLQGQLLIYLFVFLGFSVFLCFRIWKQLPKSEEETSVYSREFWIFIGAATLCLMAFQVIFMTSVPVYNDIAAAFGFDLNMAPPVDQVAFYTEKQLWGAIVLALLSGTGQFFWWKKMSKETLLNELKTPLIITLALSTIVLLLGNVTEVSYLLLLVFSIYSIVANGKILLGLRKTNLKLAGGSVAHIGIAMMLIGIIFSSGYSKILSMNNTGIVWSSELPDEINQNNLLLFLNEPRPMADYSLNYKGMRKLIKKKGFVDVDHVRPTNHPLKMIALRDCETHRGIQVAKGDTLQLINGENTYFEVIYRKNNGREFKLFPRVQDNPNMGVVYSPDIDRRLIADLYTHVRTFPDPESEPTWSETEFASLQMGQTFFVNDYAATFLRMEPTR
ncbi:MAG: cytochrome c biogenesis protein CcsA, partial [Bacteroidota bacterium]